MGYVLHYKFNSKDVVVEYDIECDDGKKETVSSKVNLQADRFSQTHFTQKHGTFESKDDCTQQTNECIQSVSGRKILKPAEIEAEFENCFGGKVKFASIAFNATTTSHGERSFPNPGQFKYSVILFIFITFIFI
jgi:hypothetical protein